MCVHLPQQHHPSQHTTTHSLTCWYSDGDDGDSGFSTHPRSEGILRCFWYLQSDSRTVYWGDLRLFLCLPIRPLIIVVYAHYWRGSYQRTQIPIYCSSPSMSSLTYISRVPAWMVMMRELIEKTKGECSALLALDSALNRNLFLRYLSMLTLGSFGQENDDDTKYYNMDDYYDAKLIGDEDQGW